jgi:short-subunit dehydrogenase
MTLRVLVTGPSRGIGRHLACLAAQRGAEVLLLGRSSAALSALHTEITGTGGHARMFPCDLGRRDEKDR